MPVDSESDWSNLSITSKIRQISTSKNGHLDDQQVVFEVWTAQSEPQGWPQHEQIQYYGRGAKGTEKMPFELKLKPWSYISGEEWASIIINCLSRMNSYEEVVEWACTEEARSILNSQLHERYELQSFKVEECLPEQMRKAYLLLKQKRVQGQYPVEHNSWSDNERKIFIWFIVLKAEYHRLDETLITKEDWASISMTFFGKRAEFLQFQYLNMLKPMTRITWNEHQDQLLVTAVRAERAGKWNEVSRNVFYQSEGTIFKSPKHCRERWLNHLDTSKIHGKWTDREDVLIFEYVLEKGKKWSKIVPLLRDTRTQHMIKNRYNSLIGKARQNRKQTEREIVEKLVRTKMTKIDAENPQPVPMPAEQKPEQELEKEDVRVEVVKEAPPSPLIKQEIRDSESRRQEQEEPLEEEEEFDEYAEREPQEPLVPEVPPGCGMPVKQEPVEGGEVVYPFMGGSYMGDYNPSCYYDYNSMMYMNQMNPMSGFYYAPPYPLPADCNGEPPPTADGQTLVSKNSSFNPYQHQQ